MKYDLCVLLYLQAGGTLPSQYFAKKRGIANGIVFAGGGIGGAVLSVSMQALLNRVGVAWTFRILGFVTLATTIPAAMLLKERTRRASSSIEWYGQQISHTSL
jgi:nitrate/nitrite transporter NarK